MHWDEADGRDRRAIEHEILAFLIEDREAVEAQGAAQQFDRRGRLLDDAKKRVRIGSGDGATFRAAAHFLEEKFDLLREIVRGGDSFRHRTRSVIGQDKTLVAFALQEHTFEDMFAEIDAND